MPNSLEHCVGCSFGDLQRTNDTFIVTAEHSLTADFVYAEGDERKLRRANEFAKNLNNYRLGEERTAAARQCAARILAGECQQFTTDFQERQEQIVDEEIQEAARQIDETLRTRLHEIVENQSKEGD